MLMGQISTILIFINVDGVNGCVLVEG